MRNLLFNNDPIIIVVWNLVQPKKWGVYIAFNTFCLKWHYSPLGSWLLMTDSQYRPRFRSGALWMSVIIWAHFTVELPVELKTFCKKSWVICAQFHFIDIKSLIKQALR